MCIYRELLARQIDPSTHAFHLPLACACFCCPESHSEGRPCRESSNQGCLDAGCCILRSGGLPQFKIRSDSVDIVFRFPGSCEVLQQRVKVQAESGGHSYASYSSGGPSGCMVIDLENFQEISLGADGIARVGAGVRLWNSALGVEK